jgi:DNA (cytosine-5)-methyltransferase 1
VLTHFSLFTGAGGFDIAAEKAGFKTVGQCEQNRQCLQLLEHHFPGVPKWRDVRDVTKQSVSHAGIHRVTLISGGDPCPIRSRARSNGESKHPDLSGHFLAVVGQLRPRWVVRENVPAPDDKDFEAALDVLGYRCVIIRTDGGEVTGQTRKRDFIVGSLEEAWSSKARQLPFMQDGTGSYKTRLGTEQVIPALTTHRTRYDSRDCYIWDGKLRILDIDEREAFAGFPKGWFIGLSEGAVARMCGNAVIPGVVYPILQAIADIETAMREERRDKGY